MSYRARTRLDRLEEAAAEQGDAARITFVVAFVGPDGNYTGEEYHRGEDGRPVERFNPDRAGKRAQGVPAPPNLPPAA